MAQITVYAQGTIDWDATDGWNSQADGLGTAYTNPQNGTDTFICDLNDSAVTANVDITVDEILAAGATAVLTVSGTRTITAPAINYTGTRAFNTAMIEVSGTSSLTLNGIVNSTGAIAVVHNSSGAFVLNGVDGVAIRTNNSIWNRGTVEFNTITGSSTINGSIESLNAGPALHVGYSGGGTRVVNGDVIASANAPAIYCNVSGLQINGNIIGEITNNREIIQTNNYFTWTPAATRTVASNKKCHIMLQGTLGQLIMTDVVVECSGKFILESSTTNAGVVLSSSGASIKKMTADAEIVSYGPGGSSGIVLPVTSPVIPLATHVYPKGLGLAFGYAGDPQLGTLRASNIGSLSEVASSENLVAGDLANGTIVDDVTGTLTGGGYTYGSEDAAHVLTTATASGSYHAPEADEVISTATFGPLSATTGTFTYPTTSKVIDDTSYGVSGTGLTGVYHPTLVSEVLDTIVFGANSAETGTYHAPESSEVISTALFGVESGTTGTYDISNVSAENIRNTIVIGSITGTLESPIVGNVRDTITYGAGGTQYTGTLEIPTEAQVETGVTFGAGGTEYTGTLETVGNDWTSDERAQIRYRLGLDGATSIPTGSPELGSIGSDWEVDERQQIRYRLGIDGSTLTPSVNEPNLDVSVSSLMLIDTTVATAPSQTQLTLTAGATFDDAYLGQTVVLYDDSNSNYPSVRRCTAYTGATRTLTLDEAPDFTMEAGDGIRIFPSSKRVDANWTHLLDSAVETPNESGIPLVDVSRWYGQAIPAPSETGVPLIDLKYWNGESVPSTSQTGVPIIDLKYWNSQSVPITNETGVPIVDLLYISGQPVEVDSSPVEATLVSSGLDAISTTAPTGVASNFREMLVQTWRRFFKKADRDINANTIQTYADNGSTVITIQEISDVSGVETQGAATEP